MESFSRIKRRFPFYKFFSFLTKVNFLLWYRLPQKRLFFRSKRQVFLYRSNFCSESSFLLLGQFFVWKVIFDPKRSIVTSWICFCNTSNPPSKSQISLFKVIFSISKALTLNWTRIRPFKFNSLYFLYFSNMQHAQYATLTHIRINRAFLWFRWKTQKHSRNTIKMFYFLTYPYAMNIIFMIIISVARFFLLRVIRGLFYLLLFLS